MRKLRAPKDTVRGGLFHAIAPMPELPWLFQMTIKARTKWFFDARPGEERTNFAEKVVNVLVLRSIIQKAELMEKVISQAVEAYFTGRPRQERTAEAEQALRKQAFSEIMRRANS
jgi:macrodomain Ter protein organizer (MatP/YcbG family)